MHRVLASLALVGLSAASALCAAVALSATVAAAAAPSYRIDAPCIRDRAGRAVFFHGVNAVWKLTPYYPPSTLFGDSEATSYFDRRDADVLALVLIDKLGIELPRQRGRSQNDRPFRFRMPAHRTDERPEADHTKDQESGRRGRCRPSS